MKAMEVGDRVAIRVNSVFYGMNEDDNPADKPGRVISRGELGCIVRWEHSGETNSYSRKDLKYWKVRVPKHVPLEPKTQEELLAACTGAIAKCKKENQAVIARYAFVYNTGKSRVATNTACHSTVLTLNAGEKRSVAYITTCINRGSKKDCKEEVAISYYDWLFNRSPYADVFITKDARGAYNGNKYAICDASAPANLLQGALVATRQTWEHNNVCYVQTMMEDRGVDGNTAHLIGGLFGRLEVEGALVPQTQGAGHFHLDMRGMSLKDFRTFIKNKPVNLHNPYNEGGDAYGVHKLFIDTREGPMDREYIKRYIKEVGALKAKTSTNPFALAKKGGVESVNVDELANHVLAKGIFV